MPGSAVEDLDRARRSTVRWGSQNVPLLLALTELHRDWEGVVVFRSSKKCTGNRNT